MQRKSSESVLIDLARQSLFEFFAGGDKEDQEFPVDDETVSGVFVTLKRYGMLRGCRGCVEGTYPLRKTIWEVSRSSAFDDPRFNPMEQEELEGLEISISLLGMMEQVKVEDPSQFREKIQLGRDGICLRLKGSSALFLPEVAPEQGWNVETTLRQLCRKAGLEEDDWRNPETEVLCFQTKHLED